MSKPVNLHSTQGDVFIAITNGLQQPLLMMGPSASIPDDTVAGYAQGCQYNVTDSTDLDAIIYYNVGSATSANFDAIQSA